MFKNHEKQKNSYLHVTFSDLNPLVLNRSVNQTLENQKNHTNYHNESFGKVTSQQPNLIGSNIDQSRINVSYGIEEIPSILRGINSKILKKSLASLNTLHDTLYNPEKLHHALKFNITQKLFECLEWFQNFVEESSVDKGLKIIFENYKIIAENILGANSILEESKIIDQFLYILQFGNTDECQCILRVFYEMTSHPTIAQVMVDSDFVYQLKNIKSCSECIEDIPEFYDLNANLFERNPQLGFDLGYSNFLLTKLDEKNALLKNILRLFAIIVGTSAAQKQCDASNVIPKLTKILKCKNLSDTTQQYAVITLHNVTLSTRARWQCREMNEIPMLLIQLAHSKYAPNLQLACLQALRQITEMPSIKDFIRKTCKELIKVIPYESKEVEEKRDLLLQWLRSKPYPQNESGGK